MILEAARAVRAAGGQVLRGGAFKPRTSPYSFQGLGQEGLDYLAEAKAETGLPVVTEAVDEASLEAVSRVADIVQIGARNMQNYSLLRRAGQLRIPVLLKRGMSATLDEFLQAAEYILNEGNYDVILCERGVRTFTDHSRNTLDLSAVPVLKRTTHLPVLVDPSHATGSRQEVLPMSLAAAACGADGLLVEMHPRPPEALSDGPQSLTPADLGDLVTRLRRVAAAVDRTA
jgi:3-deoxy-7-phosphoheptulonate synthase